MPSTVGCSTLVLLEVDATLSGSSLLPGIELLEDFAGLDDLLSLSLSANSSGVGVQTRCTVCRVSSSIYKPDKNLW